MIEKSPRSHMNKDLALTLSQRTQRIKPSPIAMLSAQAEAMIAAGKPIVNLTIGEPDFDTPAHIKEAAIKALHDGRTKYTAVDGTASLKQAIINKFARDNALTYTPEQIIVSCGAKHSIYNVFTAVLDAGDEVIIQAPYWVSYPDMVKLTDGNPVTIKTDAAQNFKMTPQQLQGAINEHTRILMLNSPSNPTGVAYTLDELKALAAVLLEHPRIIILSDDIYEHNLFHNKPFAHILNACPELYDRTMVVNSVSKTYAMTGWRIGYTAGPAKIIAAMKKAQSQSTSNPTTVSQYAAEAALNGDQQCVKDMTNAYQERHDFLVKELSSIPGFKVLPADGTFYSFPSIEELLHVKPEINTDIAFAEYLLNDANVAAVPGSAFGAPGCIRFSYATSIANLQEAVKRIRAAVTKLQAI